MFTQAHPGQMPVEHIIATVVIQTFIQFVADVSKGPKLAMTSTPRHCSDFSIHIAKYVMIQTFVYFGGEAVVSKGPKLIPRHYNDVSIKGTMYVMILTVTLMLMSANNDISIHGGYGSGRFTRHVGNPSHEYVSTYHGNGRNLSIALDNDSREIPHATLQCNLNQNEG